MWPWFHTLAHNYSHLLNKIDVGSALVTTDKHFDEVKFEGEVEILEKFTLKNLIPDTITIIKVIRNFEPDYLITEVNADPRFFLATIFSSVKSLHCVHDVNPHDSTHRVKLFRRLVHNFYTWRSSKLITFSKSSLELSRADYKVTLLPELPLCESIRTDSNQRRNYVFFGRIRPYKNLDWLVENWPEISNNLDGEELHIFGKSDKDYGGVRVRHFNEVFHSSNLSQKLGSYRAAIFPYQETSQSGALLFAHASNVTSITTELPGFIEFQPPNSMYMNISDHRVLKEILEQQMYLEQENGLAEMAKGHLRELERNALLDIEFILHQLCRAGAPEVINSRTFRS